MTDYKIHWQWEMKRFGSNIPPPTNVTSTLHRQLIEKLENELGVQEYSYESQSVKTLHGRWHMIGYFQGIILWKLSGETIHTFNSDCPYDISNSPITAGMIIPIIQAVISAVTVFILGYFLLEGLKTVKTIIYGEDENGNGDGGLVKWLQLATFGSLILGGIYMLKGGKK